MTSGLLVKSRKRLVAVSDGRLSRSSGAFAGVTYDDTRKLIEFPISYKIPRFMQRRFDRYSDYVSNPWYVAYAGTHIVTSEIIDAFRQRLGRLYLTRDPKTGDPFISDHFDTSGEFFEDCEFRSGEAPKVSSRLVLEELRAAFEAKGSAYSNARKEMPDTQFLLFGNDEETGEYEAFRLSVDENGYHPGQSLNIRAERVRDGVLTAIGSGTVASAAYDDQELMTGLQGWDKEPDDFAFLQDEDWENKLGMDPAEDGPGTTWGIRKIAERFCQIIRATEDESVGGQLMVAEGSSDLRITVLAV